MKQSSAGSSSQCKSPRLDIHPKNVVVFPADVIVWKGFLYVFYLFHNSAFRSTSYVINSDLYLLKQKSKPELDSKFTFSPANSSSPLGRMWPNHTAPTGRCSRSFPPRSNQRRVRGDRQEAWNPLTNETPAQRDVAPDGPYNQERSLRTGVCAEAAAATHVLFPGGVHC